MEEELKAAGYHPADTNGDGCVTAEEHAMYMEFKRKELEDLIDLPTVYKVIDAASGMQLSDASGLLNSIK